MIEQFSSDCNDWTTKMKSPANEMSSFDERLQESVRPYHRAIDECQRQPRSSLWDWRINAVDERERHSPHSSNLNWMNDAAMWAAVEQHREHWSSNVTDHCFHSSCLHNCLHCPILWSHRRAPNADVHWPSKDKSKSQLGRVLSCWSLLENDVSFLFFSHLADSFFEMLNRNVTFHSNRLRKRTFSHEED